MHDVGDLAERLLADLRTVPPGTPVAVTALARRMQCATADVLAAGESLRHREQGDHDLVTVVRRTEGDDDEFYVSRVPLTLNDEPETR
ncbi:hypothetical protein CIW49_24780 [Mycolicibacterium sp. P1-18]|uniref:hypothetical protein n=1 Tax=Mycolicibacterium sp. P1-18 TaxID=2024615 RepID=UPI0011F20AB9|nr:hypothetical protein [Mycolicibacterium sp. P1-18]KAA0094760.1 hypothetical protein CIW49_24780 [Mycolicibacterium sp. P1-18]